MMMMLVERLSGRWVGGVGAGTLGAKGAKGYIPVGRDFPLLSFQLTTCNSCLRSGENRKIATISAVPEPNSQG